MTDHLTPQILAQKQVKNDIERALTINRKIFMIMNNHPEYDDELRIASDSISKYMRQLRNKNLALSK